MSEDIDSSTGNGNEEQLLQDLGHPRGTLAIVIIYALLFAFGWLGLYLFQFMSRGVPTH